LQQTASLNPLLRVFRVAHCFFPIMRIETLLVLVLVPSSLGNTPVCLDSMGVCRGRE
jgi:hypothetical protein